MDFGFPRIYYCPSCGKKMKMEIITSYTVSSSAYFSDGDVKQSGICCPHFTPELSKCPHCDTVFFRHNAKSEETKFITNTSKIKYIQEPGRSDLINAIKNKTAKNSEEETAIREDLWHDFNKETRYGYNVLNDSELKIWQDNCSALLLLTKKVLKKLRSEKNTKNFDENKINSCIITIAELNRNLGKFDKCMEILNELDSSWSWYKKQLAWECKAKNIYSFELITREEMNHDKLKKQYSDIFYKRGQKFLQNYGRRNIKKALADFIKAESLGMRGSLFYEERGLLYLNELNDPQSAIADFTKALKQNDDFSENSRAINLSNRSNAYFLKGDLKKALIDIQTAISEESNNEDFYFARSKIYEAMGNTKAAEDDKHKAETVKLENIKQINLEHEKWEAIKKKPKKVSFKKGIIDKTLKTKKIKNKRIEI